MIFCADLSQHCTVYIFHRLDVGRSCHIMKYLVFTAMLTDPRINASDVTPSCDLIFTFRGEKCIQYYTIYSVQYLHVGCNGR